MTVTNKMKYKPDFENLKTTFCNNNECNGASNKKTVLLNNDVFLELMEQNKRLKNKIDKIRNEIKSIKKKFAEDFDKNLTFGALFLSIEQMIDEYDTQTKTFETYANIYNDICNEENIVKTLDILRMILTDRKAVLSNIISELIKIQRLANDRIKIDISNSSDEDVDDILDSDSL